MNEEMWWQTQNRLPLTTEEQTDFMLLMSLQLDGLLDAVEGARFETYLTRHAGCAREWRQWQRLHQEALALPVVEPPVDFVAKVDLALAQQEQRQQWGQGVFMGLLVVLLWGGLLVTMAGLCVYLLVTPGLWLSDLIHNLALISAACTRWLAMTRTSLLAFLSTPQATALGIGYLASALVLLSLWLRFLQRTLAIETVNS